MTLQPFNTLVELPDYGVWHQLSSIYHQDRSHFKAVIEALTKGKDEYVGAHSKAPSGNMQEEQPERIEEKSGVQKSFYETVIEECECGSCLNTFARSTRTPWRAKGSGKFVNAEHGTVEVADCPVSVYSGPPGYIYRSFDMKKQQIRITREEEEAIIKARKLKSDLRLSEMQAQKVREEAEAAAKARKRREDEIAQHRALDDVKKQIARDELVEEEKRVKSSHDEAYEEHKDICYQHRKAEARDFYFLRDHYGVSESTPTPTGLVERYIRETLKEDMRKFINPIDKELSEIRRKIKNFDLQKKHGRYDEIHDSWRRPVDKKDSEKKPPAVTKPRVKRY